MKLLSLLFLTSICSLYAADNIENVYISGTDPAADYPSIQEALDNNQVRGKKLIKLLVDDGIYRDLIVDGNNGPSKVLILPKNPQGQVIIRGLVSIENMKWFELKSITIQNTLIQNPDSGGVLAFSATLISRSKNVILDDVTIVNNNLGINLPDALQVQHSEVSINNSRLKGSIASQKSGNALSLIKSKLVIVGSYFIGANAATGNGEYNSGGHAIELNDSQIRMFGGLIKAGKGSDGALILGEESTIPIGGDVPDMSGAQTSICFPAGSAASAIHFAGNQSLYRGTNVSFIKSPPGQNVENPICIQDTKVTASVVSTGKGILDFSPPIMNE